MCSVIYKSVSRGVYRIKSKCYSDEEENSYQLIRKLFKIKKDIKDKIRNILYNIIIY